MNNMYMAAAAAPGKGTLLLEGRNAPPNHFLFRVESFSSLSKASIPKLVSNRFQAEDYKWRLVIYPAGNKTRNVEDHISIYLELLETASLPAGWELCVTANFFIFNQLQNKYLVQTGGVGLRYHLMNNKLGIDKFIDLNTFSNSSNGYLSEDTCVFGVELLVARNKCERGRLSLMKEPLTWSHTWKIKNFSNLVNETYVSKPFGRYQWIIMLYRNGNAEGKGNSISIYVQVPSTHFPSRTNLFLRYILRIKDQRHAKDTVRQGSDLFEHPNALCRGWDKFLPLAELKDPEEGYLVHDTRRRVIWCMIL